jgi:hypothetical protein
MRTPQRKSWLPSPGLPNKPRAAKLQIFEVASPSALACPEINVYFRVGFPHQIELSNFDGSFRASEEAAEVVHVTFDASARAPRPLWLL